MTNRRLDKQGFPGVEFRFFLGAAVGGRAPRRSKQPAPWRTARPGCRHKIMSKLRAWRPIKSYPTTETCLKDPFVRQKTATPYCLKCLPNGQVRATAAPTRTREQRTGAQRQRQARGRNCRRASCWHARKSSEPVSSKMANMILHENYCDGIGRASAKHLACLPAGCALKTPVHAALTDAAVVFLAFPGFRLAKPSGCTR